MEHVLEIELDKPLEPDATGKVWSSYDRTLNRITISDGIHCSEGVMSENHV